ncbi:MAG: S9 family peptidase [Hyphomonas sp.]
MRLRSIVSGLSVLALCAPLALAQGAPPPLEAYGNMPLFSSAELSPDGTRIAAIANTATGDSVLMVMGRDGKMIRQVGASALKPRGIDFYDNEHVVLFASETIKTTGFKGKYEYSGAYSINLETGKTVTLLDQTDGMFPAQRGLGHIVGRGEDKGTVLMPAFMGSAYSDPTYDLLKVSLSNGRGRNALGGSSDTADWFSDGKGGVLARERYNNKRNEYRIDVREGKGWKTIFEDTKADLPPLSISGIMPDGSGLAFVYADDEEVFDGLMVMDYNGNVRGPILGRTGHEIDSVYTDDERRVVGVLYSGMLPEYEFLDPALKASYETVMTALPDATVYLDSWSDDRKVVLYQAFDASFGEGWLLHDTETGKVNLIARVRSDIPADQIGALLTIEYKARDGLTIPAVLTLPPGAYPDDGIKRPLVVMPHGGPASYDRMDFDWMAQFVASRGYVVLQPNFRGSSGFGQAFLDAGRGEWGGKMQDDLTDGVEALAGFGLIDKDRVCIVGASYGGYAALASAAFHPDVYKCSISIAGVSDLNAMISERKESYGRNHWVLSYWEGIMADGDARRKKLDEISPANAADRIKVPVLLIHGLDDTVVPIGQSERMERALKRANKPVEFVKLKGEDHNLSGPETRLQTLREIDRFLTTHLPAG